MNLKWDYSLETEAKRVIHAAHQIGVGFYRLNGFYVVPEGSMLKELSNNLVVFPDIATNKIPRFWEKAKRIDIYKLPIEADIDYAKEVANLMRGVRQPNFIKTEELWHKMEKEFWEAVETVIPGTKDKVLEITVMPTIFGTNCSFSVPSMFPSKIAIYLREDQDMIYGLAEGILTALTRTSVFTKLEGSWAESEMIVDWLLTESTIGKVVKKYQKNVEFNPTLKSTREKQNANLLKLSDEFCQKLGAPSFDKPFSIKQDKPLLFDKPIPQLNSKEHKVLVKLLENANEVVTTDQVAELMFENEDDFSLYAIAKTMQRLRDKLEAAGISGSYIQTLRGKGYVMRN